LYADPPLRSDGLGDTNQCSPGMSSGHQRHANLHHCRQLIIMQAKLDQSISDLLLKVQNVYEFLLEEDTLSNLDTMKDTLARIAQVISNCAQFIKNYSETKSFCTPNPFLDNALIRHHYRETSGKAHRVRNEDRCRRL